MIERLTPPCTPASLLHSAVNAKVWQLARWTLRHPREVDLDVNRRIGVRTRRVATEGQLRAALRYAQERLAEVVSQVDGSLGEPREGAVVAKLAQQGGFRAGQTDPAPSGFGQQRAERPDGR
jgi:hypothetical protein